MSSKYLNTDFDSNQLYTSGDSDKYENLERFDYDMDDVEQYDDFLRSNNTDPETDPETDIYDDLQKFRAITYDESWKTYLSMFIGSILTMVIAYFIYKKYYLKKKK